MSLPSWVCKRDGRLSAFEPDKISRALFAATETLGRPNAFLAREMTDGVLHFLAAEDEHSPATAQIAELVVKVVRELGQPALSQAFAQGRKESRSKPRPAGLEDSARCLGASPFERSRHLAHDLLERLSLRDVFARDLAAAHEEGLLTLGNLDCPFELAGCVLGPARLGRLLESILRARNVAGHFIALDCPDLLLGECSAPDLVRELELGLDATGLRAVVNLNCAEPPSWAEELAEGPLFAGQAPPPDPRSVLRDELLEHLLTSRSRLRVDWHLGECDFRPDAEGHLCRLARRALEGAALAFVFDRPRRPIGLAEGLDRRRPAALLFVGLHLPRLAERLGAPAPARFLPKLGSLARLALSAAVQKREFLRRRNRPELTQGFLLDRARLVIVPVGVQAVLRTLQADAEVEGALVRQLGESLTRDGQSRRLEACLDSFAELTMRPPASVQAAVPAELVAGLTCFDATAPTREQLQRAGPWHAVAEAGTAVVAIPDGGLSAEAAVELLRFAWRQTAVARLRFVPAGAPPRQLTAAWDSD